MPKNKEARPQEWYKSQIRHLKKENQQLRKVIRELENRLAFTSDILLPEETEESSTIKCKECNKGSLKELIILDRIIKICDSCGFRTKAEKL